jgi:hypothetical protein
MPKMRAKLQVGFVQEHFSGRDGAKSQETLSMHAVAASKYSTDGSDEDNTYAKFSSGANLIINVANRRCGISSRSVRSITSTSRRPPSNARCPTPSAPTWKSATAPTS